MSQLMAGKGITVFALLLLLRGNLPAESEAVASHRWTHNREVLGPLELSVIEAKGLQTRETLS